jgi:hypothetical protein
MYRILIGLLCLGVLTLAPVGCAEKHTATQTTKLETDRGTDTKKVTVEERKTGELKDNNATNTNSADTTTTTTTNP